MSSMSTDSDTEPAHRDDPAVPSRRLLRGGGTSRSRAGWLGALERYGLLLIFVVTFVVFTVAEPDLFATEANWSSIGINNSIVAMAALAFLVPLTGGRFDLSVGGVIVLTSIFAGKLMSEAGVGLLPTVALSVLFGAALGAVNGGIVAYLGVGSFVATLGTSTVMGGVVTAWTGGSPIFSGFPQPLLDIGIDSWFHIPELVLLAVVMAVVVWFVLTQAPFGRKLLAVGSNLASANLVGLPAARLVFTSFLISGALGGLLGVLSIAEQGSATPSVQGITLLLPGIAAAFLGSTAFRPGRFNVLGTMLGILFVAQVVSGLALLGASTWVEPVFNGCALVIAVALSVYVRRRRTGTKEIGT